MLSVLPQEIVNCIFSYCQGSTNKIMKTHILKTHEFETGVVGLSRLNRDYGFKHLNYRRLNKAIIYRCPACNVNLWPYEYKRNINYEGQQMCSRSCLIEYQVAFSMIHSTY
jgi:hypothetical protein